MCALTLSLSDESEEDLRLNPAQLAIIFVLLVSFQDEAQQNVDQLLLEL